MRLLCSNTTLFIKNRSWKKKRTGHGLHPSVLGKVPVIAVWGYLFLRGVRTI